MRPWASRPSRMRPRGDVLRGADGDGEADALRRRDARCVHADDLAGRVDQRAARVARVQGGVGLDEVVDEVARLRAQRAPQGAHHAGGDRRLKAERAADGHDELADLQGVGVAQPGGTRSGASMRTTATSVQASSPTTWPAAVRPSVSVTSIPASAVHHVAVRHDEAVGCEDESRAAAGRALAGRRRRPGAAASRSVSRRRTSMFTTEGLTRRAAAITARE